MKKFSQSIALFIRKLQVLINKPYPVEPPHCYNISALLLHLCDYDHDLHRWVLRWIAYPLRNPGARMETGIIVNGSQGSGKGLFFEVIVGQLHGAGAKAFHASAILSPGQLNAFASNTTYALIDGYPSPRLAGQLKQLMTSYTVPVRVPYENFLREARNTMNVVVISNRDYFLPAAGTRRFLTIEAPPAHGPAFYAGVDLELRNGGIEVFRDYLVNRLDMGDFGPATPPPDTDGVSAPAAQPQSATAPHVPVNGQAA